MKAVRLATLGISAAAMLAAGSAGAQVADPDMTALLDRLARLEAANSALAAQIDRLEGRASAPVAPPPVAPALAPAPAPAPVPVRASHADTVERGTIGIRPAYGYQILDHAENVNRRLMLQLEARANGELTDLLTLSGGVTAIANAHFSNRPNKFGYLMRHPTGSNQRTKETQEIVLNSVQFAATFAPTSDLTGYFEMLYDPEQSFGPGTLVALARNQVQVRKAWVMWGNRAKSPLYAAAGKMDVPFGLQDTVSPFTNSTNWHAFAPLAFGGQAGYDDGNLSVRGMAILGGAQFRSANTPVDGTNIPSKVNNFALDGSYRRQLARGISAMVGGSYIHGSAYCQPYPIFHFNPCPDNVPAWSAYGQVDAGPVRLIGEFARTTRDWPGTKVPNPANPLSRFDAVKATALTFGGRYTLPVSAKATNLSVEFSKFIAGDDGSPWERQNQWVAGLSHRMGTSVDLFGEVIRTEGFAPLNFLSGGNFADGSSWSDADARSHILMLGVQAAF